MYTLFFCTAFSSSPPYILFMLDTVLDRFFSQTYVIRKAENLIEFIIRMHISNEIFSLIKKQNRSRMCMAEVLIIRHVCINAQNKSAVDKREKQISLRVHLSEVSRIE